MRFLIHILMLVLGAPALAGEARTQSRPSAAPGVDDAWRISRGAGVTIGIVDVGFDFYHPALRGRLEPGYFAPGVFHSQASIVIAHGTAVASVIGARPTAEMSGLAPEATLIAASQGMPDHVLLRLRAEAQSSSDASLETLMMERRDDIQRFLSRWVTHIAESTSAGIADLVERGARVIAIPQFLPIDQLQKYPAALAALDKAFAVAESRDVVLVLGAGNNDVRTAGYPGRAETVIVAGASDHLRRRWAEVVAINGREVRQGTNPGPRLSVLAPAFDLMIATPHDPSFYSLVDSPAGPVHETFSRAYTRQATGATSLATAVVAAVTGLVRAAAPALTAGAAVDIIQRSAADVGAPGRDDDTGYGIIDIRAAVGMAARMR